MEAIRQTLYKMTNASAYLPDRVMRYYYNKWSREHGGRTSYVGALMMAFENGEKLKFKTTWGLNNFYLDKENLPELEVPRNTEEANKNIEILCK